MCRYLNSKIQLDTRYKISFPHLLIMGKFLTIWPQVSNVHKSEINKLQLPTNKPFLFCEFQAIHSITVALA